MHCWLLQHSECWRSHVHWKQCLENNYAYAWTSTDLMRLSTSLRKLGFSITEYSKCTWNWPTPATQAGVGFGYRFITASSISSFHSVQGFMDTCIDLRRLHGLANARGSPTPTIYWGFMFIDLRRLHGSIGGLVSTLRGIRWELGCENLPYLDPFGTSTKWIWRQCWGPPRVGRLLQTTKESGGALSSQSYRERRIENNSGKTKGNI